MSVPAHAQQDDKTALFEKGAAHYQAEEFKEAAAAFEKLYNLEPSDEILFAWAQAERFADNCKKAITLLDGLMLSKSMSPSNKTAVEASIDQCSQRLDELKASEPKAPARAKPQPPFAETSGAPEVASRPMSIEQPADDSKPAWYRDPIGGALTGAGIASLGLGIGFYISGSSTNSDAGAAGSETEFSRLKDRAQSRGRIGYIGMAAGGALIAGGITWYLLKPLGSSERPVAAWLTSDGGGIAYGGSF